MKWKLIISAGIIFLFTLLQIYFHITRIRSLELLRFSESAKEKICETLTELEEEFASISIWYEQMDQMHFRSSATYLQEMEDFLKISTGSFHPDGVYLIKETDSVPEWNDLTLEVICLKKEQSGVKILQPDKKLHLFVPQSETDSFIYWSKPVFDSIQQRRILYCVLPYINAPAGYRDFVVLFYDASRISQLMHRSGLNRYGLVYMLDQQAHFVIHPLDETRSMIQLGKEFHDPVLTRLGEDVVNGLSAGRRYVHNNTVTGQLCEEMVYPVKGTGWFLGVSVYDGIALESGSYQQVLRRLYIRLLFCLIIAILFLIIYLEKQRGIVSQAFLCLFCPFLMLLTIIGVLFIYNRYPQSDESINQLEGSFIKELFSLQQDKQAEYRQQKWDPLRIVDQSSLDRFIHRYQEDSYILYNEVPKVIPTGIYIYNVQFLNSYEVKITGTFWQKFLTTDRSYPEEMMEKYQYDSYENKGVFFPGARLTDLSLTDSLAVSLENYPITLYRWNFDIDVDQELSYSLYPFGKNRLNLSLWSCNLDDNTLLTPDLDAYAQIYPNDFPGLDNHLHIKGWDVSASFFSYNLESYLCNFGNKEMYGINQFPELAYNISISRKFIDILVCKIIPLLVVLTLLFTLLFVRVKDEGFNNVIGCSGLFFVLVLDHINLRENVLSEEIMYLEYCYFFTYILLLLITITSFEIKNKNSETRYNIWVDTFLKNYFWSVILGAVGMVTILYFY